MQRGTQNGLSSNHVEQNLLLQLLAKLAIADVAAFGGLCNELTRLLPSQRVAAEGPRNQNVNVDLNKALAAATSRGLQVVTSLFSSSSSSSSSSRSSRSSSSAWLHEHEGALSSVIHLVTHFEELCDSCMHQYLFPSANGNPHSLKTTEDHRRQQVELAVATKSAGLLTTLPAASAATANMLQQLLEEQRQLEQAQTQEWQQQQQQRGEPNNSSQQGQRHTVQADCQVVLDVAARQVSLFRHLSFMWPASLSSSRSSLSSSSELAAAALPAVQLAMLLLQACRGKSPYVDIVLCVAVRLNGCLQLELEPRLLGGVSCAAAPGICSAGSSSSSGGGSGTSSSGSSSSSSSSRSCLSPAVWQLLQSEQLLRLLAATQALCTQVLQENACRLLGGSSQQGSSRTAAAATAAEDLLQAVGLGWTRSTVKLHNGWQDAKTAKFFTVAVTDTAVVAQHMLDIKRHQQQQLAATAACLLQPWALLQVQCVQLVDGWPSQFFCLGALEEMLDVAERLDAAAFAAFKRSLLQPVLLLWPHIPELPAIGSSSSSSIGSAVQSGTAAGGLERLQLRLACVLTKLLLEDGACKAELAAVIAANPALLPAVEASWCCMARGNPRKTPAPEFTAPQCHTLFETAVTVAFKNPGYLQQVFGSNAAQQQQQLLLQLYALQVTSLKTWLWSLSEIQQQQQQQKISPIHMAIIACEAAAVRDVASTCQAVLGRLTKCAVSANGASRGSSRGSTTGCNHVTPPPAAAAAAPWVALLARCLFVQSTVFNIAAVHAASTATEAACAPLDTSAVSTSRGVHPQTPFTVMLLECVDAMSRHLGAAGLPAEVMQQLQQQLAAVHEQLTSSLLARHGGIDSSSAVQQLRGLAQAVCGRIPLSSACNNPGCVSLAQRSELLLVGGKSYSRCARCKAVRYCCKACQGEHWKWHKALCRASSRPAAAGTAATAAVTVPTEAES